MTKEKLLKFLGFLIFFIFIVNLLANKFHWYYSFWYFDIIMHFLGGFWLGFGTIYLLGIHRSIVNILLFVLFLGLGWEVFEFLFNNIIAQNIFDMADSLSDIFFDTIGGLCAILYLWKRQPK